jgi:hypothetical protein
MKFYSITEIANYMKRNGIKTLYVPKSEFNMDNADVPNAGPRPSITGMRNKYWGKDALLVKQGNYVYRID